MRIKHRDVGGLEEPGPAKSLGEREGHLASADHGEGCGRDCPVGMGRITHDCHGWDDSGDAVGDLFLGWHGRHGRHDRHDRDDRDD